MNWKTHYKDVRKQERKDQWLDRWDTFKWYFNINEMWDNSRYEYSEWLNLVQQVLTFVCIGLIPALIFKPIIPEIALPIAIVFTVIILVVCGVAIVQDMY